MVLAIVGLLQLRRLHERGENPAERQILGRAFFRRASTSMSFGSVAVGNTATQSLTVTNTGTATVTISQATMTGAGSA